MIELLLPSIIITLASIGIGLVTLEQMATSKKYNRHWSAIKNGNI